MIGDMLWQFIVILVLVRTVMMHSRPSEMGKK